MKLFRQLSPDRKGTNHLYQVLPANSKPLRRDNQHQEPIDRKYLRLGETNKRLQHPVECLPHTHPFYTGTKWVDLDKRLKRISANALLPRLAHGLQKHCLDEPIVFVADSLHSLPFQWFQVLLTLFSKFFSPFPHGTCLLSVLNQYLALGEIYLPLCAPVPRNATRWTRTVQHQLELHTGLSPSAVC